MIRRLPQILAALAAGAASIAATSSDPIDVKDSFRIGTEGDVACSAQVQPSDAALKDMFDRGYAITCRDAAIPVGHLYVLRDRGGDPEARLAGIRNGRVDCQATAPSALEDLGSVDIQTCTLKNQNVGYRVYARRKGDSLYVAEGLSGYDSVLTLGLRSLVANRIVPGKVNVALTGAGDPVSFARIQAGNTSPQRALAEAYRRNNSGDYAQAAEYFSSLGQGGKDGSNRPEALANEALQKSNLGNYEEAESLFAQAEEMNHGDPVVQRQLRNFRVMHLLNQGRLQDAYAELDRPMADPEAGRSSEVKDLVIDASTADELSRETGSSRLLGGSEGLTPQDKAHILDAQALQLRGSALRLDGKTAEAAQALRQASGQLEASRGGRVAATIWMRAQIDGQLADIAEASGNLGEAEQLHKDAIALLERDYPGSSSLATTQGQLAAFYARTGRTDAALAGFRAIVAGDGEGGKASSGMSRILRSYFALLTGPAASSTSAAEMFRASQLLVRPGVAQTQAILARQLGGGSDEASRLFRQSVNLTREIEQSRAELARLQADSSLSDAERIKTVQTSLAQAEADQVGTQARLAQYPRYLAVSNGILPVEALQASMRPGEAYYKMIVLEPDAFAIFITPTAVKAFRLSAGSASLDAQVDTLRATISKEEQGQLVTLPFDVDTAHQLYGELFGPVAAEIPQVRHLIFEPDGAMLRLPANLLVMDQGSVDAYKARAARPNDDGFDFRGVAWLGRQRDISTAVSARAFRDLRQAPPSHARAQYVGFGQNEPANSFFLPAAATSAAAAQDGCGWSLGAWGRPISSAELLTARQVLTSRGEGQADVITGKAFSDDAIEAKGDLDQYRIVHFATHGLLAPPRPGCPARPALMTSFGGAGSDGLLSFAEIFDLHLDADVVILSACDTAAQASVAANREAGLTTGGASALDGLVRAFVGAGGRMVIASHWPVPDDFHATERLISGMFAAPPGTATADALRAAQNALMDDANTSHPFYWSGFAIVGDGLAPLIRPEATKTASAQ